MKMKNKGKIKIKNILAVVLAFTMLLTAVPMSVSAAAAEELSETAEIVGDAAKSAGASLGYMMLDAATQLGRQNLQQASTNVETLEMFGHTAKSAASYLRAAVTSGDWKYEELGDGTIVITDYLGNAQVVNIPAEIDGYKVTEIGDSAFQYNNSDLLVVSVPEGVTKIGSRAFGELSRLTSISLPSTLKEIGSSAFYECTNLTTIILPDGLTTIGREAFYKCSKLSNFSIPSNVTSIGNQALYGCSGLTSISIPNGMTSVPYGMFWGCSRLKNVTIPDSVISIEANAFNGCSALTEISIPSSVISIGGSAFSGCTGLKTVNLPSSVMTIGNSAFDNCTGLQDVTLPFGLISIGDSAFQSCSGLKSVVVPTSVNSLGSNVFRSCIGLISISIPNSITVISSGAFEYCTALEEVTIPNSVVTIDGYAFDGCRALKRVVIPDSVTDIGAYAFRNCDNLTGVILPNSITTIKSDTFYSCDNMVSIIIPDSVTSIRDYAFYHSLEYIVIPESVTSIGLNALAGISDIYYTGTQEQWNRISSTSSGAPSSAAIHFNSTGPKLNWNNTWKFSNSAQYFDEDAGYYISNSDYARLISNLSNTERETLIAGLKKKYYLNVGGTTPKSKRDDWTGSCWGMSAWVCLAQLGVLNSKNINFNLANINMASCDYSVQSAINYYQSQVKMPYWQKKVDQFMKYPQIDQLNIMKNTFTDANSTAIISFGWYSKFNSDGTCKTNSVNAHAIVGYGVESGNWDWNVNEVANHYTNRVSIYDPAVPDGGAEYDLYFNENGTWCIPGRKIVSTNSQTADRCSNNAWLQLVSSDTSVLNMVDYNTGRKNAITSRSSNNEAILNTSQMEAYTITLGNKVYHVEGMTDDSDDINVIILPGATTEGNNPLSAAIVLPESSDGYSINTESGNLDYTLNTGDYYMSVAANSSGTLKFGEDGTVTLNTNNTSDYYMNITSNQTSTVLPYSTMEISGTGATDVLTKQTGDGMLVNSDGLQDMSVFVSDGERTQTITFSTDEDNVLLSSKDGQISAFVDEDKDGTYDDELDVERTDSDPIVPTTDSEKLTRTYEGKEFDITDLFTFSENCGKAIYSIIGGTGKGTITGNGVLTVTAAGTFDIKVSTAATKDCDAAAATVTLDIKKGTVTGNVIMTNYNFGGIKSVPSLNGSTSDGSVTFYYNTSNSNQGGHLWDSVTSSKALPVGTYWMYAVVEETDLYEEFISAPTGFNVLSENGEISGDINGDGKVTAVDARWVLQIAAGTREVTDAERISVDLNKDGKVTAVDARWVLQIAAGTRVL